MIYFYGCNEIKLERIPYYLHFVIRMPVIDFSNPLAQFILNKFTTFLLFYYFLQQILVEFFKL